MSFKISICLDYAASHICKWMPVLFCIRHCAADLPRSKIFHSCDVVGAGKVSGICSACFTLLHTASPRFAPTHTPAHPAEQLFDLFSSR